MALDPTTGHRIRFPKVDTRTQPIVVILAQFERFILEEFVANGAITSVVAEDKRRRKFVHLALALSFDRFFFYRTIMLGELARFVIASRRYQKSTRLFGGVVRLANALKRLEKLF